MTQRSIVDNKALTLEDHAQIFTSQRKVYPYDIAILATDCEADQALAQAVQKALENYKAPKAFRENWFWP